MVSRLAKLVLLTSVVACSNGGSSISIGAIEPARWLVGETPTLTITGSGFLLSVGANLNSETVEVDDAFFADVGGTPLIDCRWVSSTQLTVRAPLTVPAGVHDVRVVRPDGRSAVLRAAVTVMAMADADGAAPGDPGADGGGDPWTGDPGIGDPWSGDGDTSGDPWSGDTSGDTSGDPWTGDAHTGDAHTGDGHTGDPWTGDPAGDPGGDPGDPWPAVVTETFDAGMPPEFFAGVGSWSVAGGMLQQTACSDNDDAFLSDDSWEEIEASGDVRVDAVCGTGYEQTGLIVRGQSLGNCGQLYYISCVLDTGRDQIALGRLSGSCVTDGTWSGFGPIDVGVWYRMTLRAEGDVLTCTLEGPTLTTPLTTTFTDPAPAVGAVGFNGSGTSASWDNIVIQPLP